MMYMLDSDTVIFMLRGLRPGNKATHLRRAQRLALACQAHQEAGDIVVLSSITLSELEYGARCCTDYAAEKAAIQKIASPFVIFEFDSADCPMHYGQVRRDLELSGTPIGAMDYLVAAHALARNATLVTNNLAHFQRVKNLPVVNWS
jgi:tRNA(fMet)-specific endonuclease VapC